MKRLLSLFLLTLLCLFHAVPLAEAQLRRPMPLQRVSVATPDAAQTAVPRLSATDVSDAPQAEENSEMNLEERLRELAKRADQLKDLLEQHPNSSPTLIYRNLMMRSETLRQMVTQLSHIPSRSAQQRAESGVATLEKDVWNFIGHQYLVQDMRPSPLLQMPMMQKLETNIESLEPSFTEREWQMVEARVAIERAEGKLMVAVAQADAQARATRERVSRTTSMIGQFVPYGGYAAAGARVAAATAPPITNASFSPDGTKIVTASADRTARIWDTESGQKLQELEGHTASVASASFSPDGKQIVTASSDGTARIWDAESGTVLRTLEGHTAPVSVASFSPDGTKIVTASEDRTARIWNAESGQELQKLEGHTAPVSTASFSPNEKKIVTASADGTVRIWDAESGRELQKLEDSTNTVLFATFSSDGKRIITASREGTARIWILE